MICANEKYYYIYVEGGAAGLHRRSLGDACEGASH